MKYPVSFSKTKPRLFYSPPAFSATTAFPIHS